MREFFRGSRRKVGLGFLVIALVFMSAWTRSLLISDEFDFPDRYHISNSNTYVICDRLISAGNAFSWHRIHTPIEFEFESQPYNSHLTPEPIFLDWRTLVRTEWTTSAHGRTNESQLKWRRWGGLYIGESNLPDGRREVAFIVHYWSIIIPLTLISCWLLLSTPRKLMPKKITELIPESMA
jgi:hypothetical protein